MVVLSKATAAETPYRIRACSSPGDDDEDVDLDDDDDDDQSDQFVYHDNDYDDNMGYTQTFQINVGRRKKL